MKINHIHNVEQSILGIPGPEVKESDPDKSLLFRRTVSDLSTEQYQRYMGELVKKIEVQGQKLAQKADIKDLQKYRELISEFIKETVSNSYHFNKENSYEARRRHKVFATVKKINAKLEELAQELLASQADNLAILNKVDDIRGLILDIML